MSTKTTSKPTKPTTCTCHLLEILSTCVRGLLTSLEDVEATKLSPISSDQKFTVFLDMDKTLIHSILSSPSNPPPKKYDFIVEYSESIGYVTKRPYVDEFLEYLKGNNFEIVIFTAGNKSYASPLLDILDPKGLISHRLYRDSCKLFQGKLVKDLSCLGRNLNNVVIVDDNPHYTILQRKNAIQIRPFTDDLQDHELKKLMNDFFEECNRYNNLQDAVTYYRHAARVQHKRKRLTRSSKQAIVFEDEEYGLLEFIYLDDQ